MITNPASMTAAPVETETDVRKKPIDRMSLLPGNFLYS
jgi:hypothetical protein